MSSIYIVIMNNNKKRTLVLPEVRFRELVHISNHCEDPAVACEELQHRFNDMVVERNTLYVLSQFAIVENEYFKSVCDSSNITGGVEYAGHYWGIGVGLSPEEAVLNCFTGFTMDPNSAQKILNCSQLFSS